jgi:hypothetical protein
MEGDSLTLDCIATGLSHRFLSHQNFDDYYYLGADDLELAWLRNHKEIPDNPDFRRERDGSSFKLVVAEV